MVRAFCAVAVLIAAACAPSSDPATIASGPADTVVAVSTTVPTTEALLSQEPAGPTVPPTAVTVPEPAPTVASVPTVAPLATPTTVPAPSAAPAVQATVVTQAAPTQIPQSPGALPVPTGAPTPLPAAVDLPQEVLVSNGAEIYQITCARCHGAGGTGALYAGLIGVGSRYSTSGMIEELTNGHPVTFGFANQLSAEEIASVVAYVKATFP